MNQAQVFRLTLNDFATDELCGVLEPVELFITYGRLAELLDQAEEIQRAREHGPGSGIRSSRKTRRRKRDSSSPDLLLSEDETQFRLEEQVATERADASDNEFRPPRRRRY